MVVPALLTRDQAKIQPGRSSIPSFSSLRGVMEEKVCYRSSALPGSPASPILLNRPKRFLADRIIDFLVQFKYNESVESSVEGCPRRL
jgi:hypothetical protein